MRISIIVAMTPKGIIGQGGGMPWHEPEDLRHFKRTTTGHAIIMGRKTFDSIGKALPGRRNIVISRAGTSGKHGQIEFAHAPTDRGHATTGKDSHCATGKCERTPGTGLDFVGSLEDALALCRHRNETSVFVVGGAQIYALALPVAEEMIVTWVDRPGIAGDTWFPAWDRSAWEEVRAEKIGELTVRRYRRKEN